MSFFVYLLECSDGSYYCGYTCDLKARVEAHNNGVGGKYTRARRPVKLVYAEERQSREKAMQRETEIKKFSRKQKKELVNHIPEAMF